MKRSIFFLFCLSLLIFSLNPSALSLTSGERTSTDISGLAHVKSNLFLSVHDTKNADSPRISLLELPDRRTPLAWPEKSRKPRDLESITPIPGSGLFLAAESDDRIFLLSYKNKKIEPVSEAPRPSKVKNVESTAVARVGGRYIYLEAERADSLEKTAIAWTTLELNPLRWGEFQYIGFSSPFGNGKNIRQISDLAIDPDNNIYISSTVDPGNNGPFRSAIYRIGKVGDKGVILNDKPQEIGIIDGFKVEALAFRGRDLFFGTDDENYGGVVRELGRK